MIPKRIPKKFKIKFGFHFLSLNSKGIQMEAADRPPKSPEMIPKMIPTRCKIMLVSTHSPLTQKGSK